MKHFFLLLTFLFVPQLSALDTIRFSSATVKNGESILIMYEHNTIICDLKLQFEDKSYKFSPHPLYDNLSYLILPVHYNTKPGEKTVKLSYKENATKVVETLPPLIVLDGSYPKETLSVDPAKIVLSSSDQKRVEKEYLQAEKIYATVSDTLQIQCETCKPMDSMVTSKFGNERLFNGSRKSYHSGIDYRAKTPQEVKSIGRGRVVLIADRFYAGYSVILDHGHGIYSGYYHLSSAKVAKDDLVSKGQIIALSGKSGRVTGPHLHFAMKVHGITVNPKILLEQIDTLLQTKSL